MYLISWYQNQVDENLQEDQNTLQVREREVRHKQIKIMEPLVTFSKDRDVVGDTFSKKRNTRDECAP